MDRIFSRIGEFIVARSKLNIIVVVILTIIMGLGVTRLEMKMGNDVLVSSDSEAFKNTATYQENFGGDSIYILLSGERDQLISQATVKEISRFTEEALRIEDITGTTDFVTLMNEMRKTDAPAVEEMSTEQLRQAVFSDNGNVPGPLKQLIPANGERVLIVMNTSNDTEMDTYVRINDELNDLIEQSNFADGITVKTGGVPIVEGEVKGEVMTTMGIMLSLAVVLMILVLFLVFPVRRRIISLGFVLVGLLWTFGFMGWAGIPITLATMATLPIIIGLGTDFGVQFHNRYEEEYVHNNRDAALATKNAIKHIGPGVGIAVFIMALSFLTMFLSKAPMMQQFGLTLAIGVLFSYAVELVLLFSAFKLLDQRSRAVKLKEYKETWLSRFLSRYAGLVGKLALPILAVAIALSTIGFSVEHKIPTDTNLLKMIPQDMKSLKNTYELQSTVGSTMFITYLVEADDVTDPEVVHWMQDFSQTIDNKYEDIQGVNTLASLLLQLSGGSDLPSDAQQLKAGIQSLPPSILKTVVSEDHRYATLQFQVNPDLSSADQLALMNEITDQVDAEAGIEVNPAGAQVMMLYGVNNIGANKQLMIVVGLAIIFIGLFLVYRRFKHSIYPLVPIMLVLGIGTEFTILIMERFREEEAKGLGAKEAIQVS
ncbi:RND family transporter [Cohnella sp. AR92]|uniref:efflux RND transporter permease subunit n=1 Tax=Cohnella sp. AR92 TaxID=648716 RepID=UPI001EDD747C|nr:efflux RND transporter permease subunit [Cohnella sp. AR92]